MTAGNIVKPRKQPRQQRSGATVEAILQAAAYILEREGYAGLNTNRIAEKAGVNIASLYQYFPNKQAVVAELHRQHVAETRAATRKAIAEHRGTGPSETAKAVVKAMIAAHLVNPALHRAFEQEFSHLAKGNPLLGDIEPLANSYHALLAQYDHDPAHAERHVWVIQTALHAIIHKGLSEHSDYLTTGALEEEMQRMLESYLGSLGRMKENGGMVTKNPNARRSTE